MQDRASGACKSSSLPSRSSVVELHLLAVKKEPISGPGFKVLRKLSAVCHSSLTLPSPLRRRSENPEDLVELIRDVSDAGEDRSPGEHFHEDTAHPPGVQ